PHSPWSTSRVTLTRPVATTDLAHVDYTRARIAHWDSVAARMDNAPDFSRAYHARLVEVYRSVVAPNQRVLEVGCGQADLLAALQPAFGLGIDFSGKLLEQARRRHPNLHFLQADVHALDLNGH